MIESARISVVILVLLILFSRNKESYAAENTLEQGDQCDYSTDLVSARGYFTLSFFNLEAAEKTNLYLGIRYTDDENAFVWVANRDTPIPNKSGVLTLDSSGNLMITFIGGEPIVLYSPPASTNFRNSTTKAILGDDGNFVLKEFQSEGVERVLWQSFDYPTDILLPGMKLGFSKKTNQKLALTSRWSSSVPGKGAYTLEWETNERSLVIKYRGVIHWSSGALNTSNHRFEPFKSVVGLSNINFSFTQVSTEEEEFINYTVTTSENSTSFNVLRASAWISLNEDGNLNGLTTSKAIADLVSCYGYNTEGGCQKWSIPECRIQDNQFSSVAGSFSIEAAREGLQTQNSSLSDCWDHCWTDCTCVAFAKRTDYSTGCYFWNGGQKLPIVDHTGLSMYVQYSKAVLSNDAEPPEIAEGPQTGLSEATRNGRKKWIWIGPTIAGAAITFLAAIICCGQSRVEKVEEKDEMESEKHILQFITSSKSFDMENIGSNGKGHELRTYTVTSLKTATDNFSLENKLGEGGFGEVYMGTMPDGSEIAVKRLSRSSKQGLQEFRNELLLIAAVQHRNLVSLLGCCINNEEKILIYEYMPNKSLDYFIFGNSERRKLLDWQKRFSIIEGIAQGILYLHNYSRLKIIHRDLKASNILLDHNMNPKISDFGMARIFGQTTLEENTKRVVGTYGYMSPEYAMEGRFSVKSDVFSFGVILLEILSGKKSNSSYNIDFPMNLVGYAWELWKKGAAMELMDPTLNESCIRQQVLRCIHIAVLCVEDGAADRPNMADVISMLSQESTPLPLPRKPAFFFGISMDDQESYKNIEALAASTNNMSITVLEAR